MKYFVFQMGNTNFLKMRYSKREIRLFKEAANFLLKIILIPTMTVHKCIPTSTQLLKFLYYCENKILKIPY